MLEAIESFVEKVDQSGLISNFEVWRLLDVDFVINCRIEKRCFEVKLINKKLKHKGDREENV